MKKCICICFVFFAFGLGKMSAADPLGGDFKFDITKLQEVDPSLVRYEEIRTIPVPLDPPRSLAVLNDGTILAGGNKLLWFGEDGTIKKEMDLQSLITCLAVGKDDRIFAGLGNHVVVLKAGGEIEHRWADLSESAIITSIALKGDKVFLADSGEKIVWVFSDQGMLLARIGDKTAEYKGFIIPSPYFDVAVGKDGSVWVANTGTHKLEEFDDKGAVSKRWGKSGYEIDAFCGCCNPAHFAFLSDGSFVTAEKGLARVKVHSQEGVFQCVVAPPLAFTPKGTKGAGAPVADLAVDKDDRIYILDCIKKSVRIFESATKK